MTEHKFEKEINQHLQQKSIIFPKVLEKVFREDYFYKSIISTRIALVMGLLLYSAFGILDIFLAPISLNAIWFIRYAIVCPLLLLTFILSFFKFFKKIMQPAIGTASLFAGLGIVAMMAIIGEEESGYYYYAGLILVFMWSYTFVRLRFIYASISGWIIVIAYEFVAIFLQRMLDTDPTIRIFINNNFFFLSSNLIGMFAGYLIEYYTRVDFLQRQVIAEKQKHLEEERNELQLKDEIISNELSIARIIQHHLIPPDEPKENIFSLYKPMEEVGGDLYDYIRFREESKIGIFLSDVSGHGVPAALITAMIKSILIHSHQHKDNPADMLIHINNLLVDITYNLFLTAFYGIYDSDNRSITYCSAGHNHPYIIYKNEIQLLEKSYHLPLAIFGEEELLSLDNAFENITQELRIGSKILFYTDGLVDVRKPDNNQIFFKHIIEDFMIETSHLSSKEFVLSLYEKLVSFNGGEQFDDDICIICIDVI